MGALTWPHGSGWPPPAPLSKPPEPYSFKRYLGNLALLHVWSGLQAIAQYIQKTHVFVFKLMVASCVAVKRTPLQKGHAWNRAQSITVINNYDATPSINAFTMHADKGRHANDKHPHSMKAPISKLKCILTCCRKWIASMMLRAILVILELCDIEHHGATSTNVRWHNN